MSIGIYITLRHGISLFEPVCEAIVSLLEAMISRSFYRAVGFMTSSSKT
jgi:hypothetical protein